MDDFKFDLLKYEKIPSVDNFLNIMLSNFYQPLILQPSRCTDNSRPALVDNIFLNSIDSITKSGNLIPKVSDHMPNFVIIEKSVSKIKPLRKQKRDFRNFNENDYQQDIKEFNFVNISADSAKELENEYTMFQNGILHVINKHAPIRELSRKQVKQQRKPWITRGILKSISIKNKLFKKFLETKDSFWYQRNKLYRDNLYHFIRKSKNNYYISYFEKFKNNSKQTWKAINDLINRSNRKPKI